MSRTKIMSPVLLFLELFPFVNFACPSHNSSTVTDISLKFGTHIYLEVTECHIKQLWPSVEGYIQNCLPGKGYFSEGAARGEIIFSRETILDVSLHRGS